MNKSFLAAIIVGCTLTACSSHPSDMRPANKVSVDNVAPGNRDTDIYNLNGANKDITSEGHEGHGAAGHGDHEGATEMHDRQDVMPNHDEHKSDIGGEEPVPAEEKTTDADKVENHN